MSFKEKWKKFRKELAWQKRQSKEILKTKWNIGAEQGKALKEKHKEVIKKKVDKNE